MDDSSKVEHELAELVSSLHGLNERLTMLEGKVTRMSITQEQGKTRLEEIQEFSENIVTLQERKLTEIEENMLEQKKLISEMRVQLQNLQNSRVNHKDVLVRHENRTKKLIDIVNDISEKQNEYEAERNQKEDMRLRRFSRFEQRGRRTRTEDLYDFDERRSSHRGSSALHRRVHSSPVHEKERRKSSATKRILSGDL